jgi:N-acylneuraminate cytidylyltransferase
MRTAGFLQAKHRFFGKTVMHEMPLERVCEIDELVDLEVAELRLQQRAQAARAEALPWPVQALVMDFDGVHTDDRVLVDQDGREAVWCNRRDGLGLEQLRKTGLQMLVLSKKLGLPCLSGIDAKLPALQRWCAEQAVSLAHTVYVGNDVNDSECLAAAGCGVAVADAHPEAKRRARFVLERSGGQGALRELCELILERQRRAP